jgi:curved DNA-binding protein CbpA
MPMADALALFRRLGVQIDTISRREFCISYFALAKRYHPDRNPRGAELMANINAARTAILNSYRNQLSHGQSRAGF